MTYSLLSGAVKLTDNNIYYMSHTHTHTDTFIVVKFGALLSIECACEVIVVDCTEYEMSKTASLCLYCLGPDCISLAHCDSSELSMLCTRHVVHAVAARSPDLLAVLMSTKPLCLDHMRVCICI